MGPVLLGWSLYGTKGAAGFVLWQDGQGTPPGAWPAPGTLRAVLHLAVQFLIAEFIVWLAAPAGVLGLLWLVLLPPVGYAVMFLRAPAVAAVAIFTVALHTANIVHWHGWAPVAPAITAFSAAVLFTIVFTHAAITAERARGEVERLAAELARANDRLRQQATQAEELAVTRERNRVAREIHDSLGHCLTVVHVQLEAARSTLDASPVLARGALDKAQAMAHVGLQEVRRSVSALRTSPLEGRSLPEALSQLAAESGAAGLQVEVAVTGPSRDMSAQAMLTVYRAAQEGLTNCRKHSGVTLARLALDYGSEGVVRLTVSDDGAGAARTADGFGLLGLRERAHLLGGSLGVRTSPGAGFVLTMEVPG
jgi:signal transduction histidine kinase